MSVPVPSAPSVPIVDLAVASPEELVTGLIRSSCVFLVNHGLTDAALAAMLGTAREFYALPEPVKARVQWSGEGPWRGWQPVYAGGPQALLLERFEVALAPDGTFDQWPAEPAAMSDAWTAVYRTLSGLASRLTTMIATGLDLPPEDLPAWTTRQHSNLVVNHYLAQELPPEPGRVRQRAHTDIGGITILWTDGTPGLQARIGPEGQWVPVDVPPGALLLQAGDLLHLWSRGRIPANDHRVVNPPRVDGEPQLARYSAVFFHHPDLDTWVAPGVGSLDHVLLRQQTSATEDAGTNRV